MSKVIEVKTIEHGSIQSLDSELDDRHTTRDSNQRQTFTNSVIQFMPFSAPVVRSLARRPTDCSSSILNASYNPSPLFETVTTERQAVYMPS